MKCSHEWRSFDGNPKVCPRCKSYTWRVPKKIKQAQEADEDENTDNNKNIGV